MRVVSRRFRLAAGLAVALLISLPLLAAAGPRGRLGHPASHGRGAGFIATAAPHARSGSHGCSSAAENLSPCTTSVTLGPNGTATQSYSIENTTFEDDAISVSCAVSGIVTSCSAPTTFITVPPHGVKTFTVTYHTGSGSGSGTVTVTTSGISELSATINVLVGGTPGVTVTPDGGAVSVDPNTPGSQAFTVYNSGTATTTYTITARCGSHVTMCNPSTSSTTLVPGASAAVSVSYRTGSVTGVADSIVLRASYTNPVGSDSGWVVVTTESHAVAVTPDGDTVKTGAALLDTTEFVVKNVGTASASYQLTTSCPTPGTGCAGPASPVTLAPGDSTVAAVTFTGGSVDEARHVALIATYTGNSAVKDSGWVTDVGIMPCTTSQIEIFPCDSRGAGQFTGMKALTTTFTVTNKISLEPVSFVYTVTCTPPLLSCAVQGGGSLPPIPPDSSARITIMFATDTIPGTATMTLTADNGAQAVAGTVAIIVSPPPPPTPLHILAITPHYSTLEVDPSQAYTRSIQVLDNGSDTVPAYYKIRRTCTTGGAIASGCTPAIDSVLLRSGTSVTVPTSFTAGATPGSTGTIRLTVWRAADSTVRDSSTVDVTVARGSSTVDVASVNPGSLLEPSLCVNVALTLRTSYECGDLRLAYPLPSTRTRNTTRTPVLIYNSRHSNPYVIVAANVTLPADGRVPQTVSARLLDSAGVKLDSAAWAGSNWAAGSTRRIAIEFDPVATRNYPEGAHRYTLEVTRTYSDTIARDTVTGTFFVVRRDHSQFGHGWWLAGLERLLFRSGKSVFYWIGGDGAARTYVRSATDPTVWGAANVDHPDTIRQVGARYVRFLPHGLKVQFDTVNGCHMETVNRLGDTTRFHYAGVCDRLDTLYLPPASAGKKYIFTYNNPSAGVWQLARMDAPPVNGMARSVSFVRNSAGQLTTIRGVTGDSVRFGYQATYDDRIVWRRNERGDTTRITYARTLYGPLSQVSVPITDTSAAVTTFVPGERRGIKGTAAVALEQAYTKVDGPRTDVGDSTLFWLDRFGAPWRVRNAVGDETLITRDSIWPALAARVQYPSGQVLGATYDTHGNIVTEADSSVCSGPPVTCATTRYTWDLAWDFVTSITNPMNDVPMQAAYDATTGNRLWQQDGRGQISRVTFHYYSSGTVAANLMSAVISASQARDSLVYDGTLGNLQRVLSPLGQSTTYHTDDIGRIDSTLAPNGIATRTYLDLLDRDTATYTRGDTLTVAVHKAYDAVGHLTMLAQESQPDPANIGLVTRTFAYDKAGRQIMEALVACLRPPLRVRPRQTAHHDLPSGGARHHTVRLRAAGGASHVGNRCVR